jgi:Uma2 family endonuclease
MIHAKKAVLSDSTEYPITLEELLPNLPLAETDGEPLESIWHRDQISFLLAILRHHWHDRDDFFVGGNTFVYYSVDQARDILENQNRATAYRGPDFFYVSNVPRNTSRKFWVVWEEGGRYPDLIIELLSPTTKITDRTIKKDLYESTFHTREYFLFDPETWKLEGWRLHGSQGYRKIVFDKRGRAWSEALDMALGTWEGSYLGSHSTWLRFFDAKGRVIPLAEEAADVEIARLKARLGETGKKKNGR